MNCMSSLVLEGRLRSFFQCLFAGSQLFHGVILTIAQVRSLILSINSHCTKKVNWRRFAVRKEVMLSESCIMDLLDQSKKGKSNQIQCKPSKESTIRVNLILHSIVIPLRKMGLFLIEHQSNRSFTLKIQDILLLLILFTI